MQIARVLGRGPGVPVRSPAPAQGRHGDRRARDDHAMAASAARRRRDRRSRSTSASASESSARASRRSRTSRKPSGWRGWDRGPGTRAPTRSRWSAQMYEIFGRDPSARHRDRRAVRSPTCIPTIASASRPRSRTRSAADPRLSTSYRIIAGDGVSRHRPHAIGQADLTRTGCYVGTVQDVTEQRRAEQRADRAARGERPGGEREPRQERVPGADEPRAAHAAELDHRLQPAARARRADAAPERARRLRAQGRRPSARADQRSARARADRGRPDDDLARAGRARRHGPRSARARRAAGPRARRQRCTPTPTGSRHDGHVHADRQRLKQVLLNLLSNAIKYNRPGGRVDVSFAGHRRRTGPHDDRRHRHRNRARPAGEAVRAV